ncbi:hypothetical protein EYF80_066849 [Liparis tanakae]|uniref:Uncharacterized protein n=1 Tax=Liparis tanakae TaxID=230148 RepID=A0A4Z2E2Z5_9TELE|nr:hypothetical protein EYF80_066849 [Liparis tanakae]
MEESHVRPDPQEEEAHPRKGEESQQTGPYLVVVATPTAVKRNHTGTTSHPAPSQEHLKEGQERRGDHHGKALPATEARRSKAWSINTRTPAEAEGAGGGSALHTHRKEKNNMESPAERTIPVSWNHPRRRRGP